MRNGTVHVRGWLVNLLGWIGILSTINTDLEKVPHHAHTHIFAVLDGERRLHDRKKFRDTILAVAHGTLTLAALRLGVDCTHASWANVA